MPVAAESCGRCGPIVRSLKPNRAVVAFALTSQMRGHRAVVAGALFHKKEGLQPRLHSRFSVIPLKTNFIIYPEKPVNSESHLHRWSDSVSAYIRSDMH